MHLLRASLEFKGGEVRGLLAGGGGGEGWRESDEAAVEEGERQIEGGCRSPLPEMVRSCVRKLSWMCDSDRVV